ncbi:Purine nucleoside permease [Golovinomyces cichoracearum]|uniref:Purine nucleoside permease n=1 Tax=Golovinomyces cichoracearum TaxID=62708 RepID=A0A420IKM2_9PEZI|nr:Purine nucleoside permease [Golovinomyces cichoracearum]
MCALVLLILLISIVFTYGRPFHNSHDKLSVLGSSTVLEPRCGVTAPKVVIISLFSPEASIWYETANAEGSIGNLMERNISVPGLSPLFPNLHCLKDGSVCQVTTGESEINAAATMTALVQSPLFDFRKTYFLVAGIAGINPKHGTLCDVAFSKYAIQVALQYEIEIRDLPDNYSSGYIPLGSTVPNEYPRNIYGTEVFELNERLRDVAAEFASKATLKDSPTAEAYRAKYASNVEYSAAVRKPSVIRCDVTTSDVYFSGARLGEAFEDTTRLFTNGSGVYCVTAQEDNAILEVMVRAAMRKIVDYSRIIIMRTASDFDRPYPGQATTENLFHMPPGAFETAIFNIYAAGTPVIQGILNGWQLVFENGIVATNYIGDIFGSLGGKPDFGPGSISAQASQTTMRRVAAPMITARSQAYQKKVLSDEEQA